MVSKIKAKLCGLVTAATLALSTPAFADYAENLKKANTLYGNKQYSQALPVYQEAYKENPNKKLGSFITQLKSYVDAQKPKVVQEPAQKESYVKEEVKKSASWPKYVLLGTDLALIGGTVGAIMSQRSAASDFNTLHAELDDTTEENVAVLEDAKAKVDSKGTLATILGVGAGLAITYTALDKFVFHKAFPENAKLSYDPQKNALAVNWKF